jgi:hypothetical protein
MSVQITRMTVKFTRMSVQIRRMSVKFTRMLVQNTPRVPKSHAGCQNHTHDVKITRMM